MVRHAESYPSLRIIASRGRSKSTTAHSMRCGPPRVAPRVVCCCPERQSCGRFQGCGQSCAEEYCSVGGSAVPAEWFVAA